MNTQVSGESAERGNQEDHDYTSFLSRIQARFAANVDNGAAPLFTTDAENMWQAYLDALPEDQRQHHTCHCCRAFVERFGPLVTITPDGSTVPAIWNADDAPELYREAITAMAKLASRAKVTGVFLSEDRVWGSPETGTWRHLSATPPAAMVYKRTILTAGQKMAERREDFKTVMYALGEFPAPIIGTALKLLRSDSLYRSEKVLGQAEWLDALHAARSCAHGPAKANVVWRAVALAPAGFCHPRSSMIGTLLEDIAAGMEYGEVSRRFAAKMHPLQYQRPQTAPTAGAIAAAEKVMEQLGAAGSLARRFARLDEVQAFWLPAPKPEAQSAAGVFGHLQPKGSAVPGMRIPAQTMTWEKFQRTVLPTAERIEFQAPSSGSYTALVTAVNADAPPILQWDSEDSRNPVSWYFWHGGSSAAQFGLRGGSFYEVDAITLKPSMWNGGHEHQGEAVMFVLAGARESRVAGAAIFPETLRSEFHGIRSVIEAYSRNATIEGMEQPHAAGYMIQKGAGNWNATVRVWSDGKSMDYRLDRWD